jgi:hypothetical protein
VRRPRPSRRESGTARVVYNAGRRHLRGLHAPTPGRRHDAPSRSSSRTRPSPLTRTAITKWEWDFGDGQPVDSTLQNPHLRLHGRRLRREPLHGQPLKVDRRDQHGHEHRDQEGLHRRQPVPGRQRHGVRSAGSTVPAGDARPDPDAGVSPPPTRAMPRTSAAGMPRRRRPSPSPASTSRTKPRATAFQSVWCFTIPGTTRHRAATRPRLRTRKFLGTGPVTARPLTPATPLVIQQGTWFGHHRLPATTPTGTTQRNSYGTGSSGTPNTTVLGAPTDREPSLRRQLQATPRSATPGTGTLFYTTTRHHRPRRCSASPATCRATIPVLAASGDTPYFGANPQLDMTASIPGAQAGLLGIVARSTPSRVALPTPFGRLLDRRPTSRSSFAVAGRHRLRPAPDPQRPEPRRLCTLHWQGSVPSTSTNHVNGMTNGVDLAHRPAVIAA